MFKSDLEKFFIVESSGILVWLNNNFALELLQTKRVSILQFLF
jgi:hypothetical protein